MFPPERIVCLTEETVETLYLLGEQDRIVGISGYCVRPPFIVAGKPANGDGRPEPERVERREGAEENPGQAGTRRTPSRASVSPGLDRVRTAARLDRKERFTALLHHVDAGLLRRAYFWLKRDAAAGVD